MRIGNDRDALRGLATLQTLGAIGNLTDGQLLERFAAETGEAAELAFEALVDRHGAMVLRVCRAHLADPNDAQDAFQATFLVLIHRARGLWVRDSLGPWLHQVARRVALQARSTAARHRSREQAAARRTVEAQPAAPRAGFELEEALHDEINRLPDRFRVPIILCDLQGLSCEEAARRLNRPVGTVKSWRSRGRDRLRSRLTQRGLAPSVGVFAPLDAVIRLVPPWRTAGEVSASAQSLAQGALKTMFPHKLKLTAAATLALMLVAGGLGAVALGVADDPPKPQAEAPAPKPGDDENETWPLSLQEAIRIGLSNTNFIRVVSDPGKDGTLRIAPTAPIADMIDMIVPSDDWDALTAPSVRMKEWDFDVEAAWRIREIERAYWRLDEELLAIPTAERAMAMAQELLNREETKADAGESDGQDVAEVRKQVRNLKRDLIEREANAADAARELREIIGLPTTDDRRIAPATTPTEAPFEWDWRAWRAKEGADWTESDVSHLKRKELGARQAHRFFETASWDRAVAAEELAEERKRYESGRASPHDYLKAIGALAKATRRESGLKYHYNRAIEDFARSTGTLLKRHQIAIADESETTPAPIEPQETVEIREAEKTDGKTYSFHLSIGSGPKPFEIRGALTITPAR